MNTNKNFEQVIKNVLENYELPYNHADWLKLEKSLPKASGISPLKIIVASVSTTIVIIGAIFTYFYLNDTEINSVNKTRLTNTNLSVIQPAQNISIPSAKDNSGTVTNKDNLQNPVHTNSKSLFSEQPQSAEQIIKNYDNSKTTQAITDNSNITNDESANNNQVFSAQQLNNIRKYEQAPPCAKFTADYFEGCSPLSVNFYLLENSDTIIYLWDFGDGQISTEQQPSHIYNDPGEYIVSLTVKYYKTELLVNYTNTTPIKVKLSPNPDFSYENNQYKFSFINQTQDG
ncbi:MAG: PKD domain-containing protein [Bacteroidia bacterium]|nr:PKD domain-containing protein [Bacteroidia bacterium]